MNHIAGIRSLTGFILFIGIVTLSPGFIHAQEVIHAWSKRFGDAEYQHSLSVATDHSNNVIITGYFSGSINLGGGPLTGTVDILLAKFDPEGHHLWSRSFGDSAGQYGYDVTVDHQNNIIITGRFHGSADFGGGTLTSTGLSDAFLAKFDPDGNHLWSTLIGDSEQQMAYSVTVDSHDNVICCGRFEGTISVPGGLPLTSAGGFDIFLVKLDPDSNHICSKRFGGPLDDSNSMQVVTDSSDHILITGTLQEPIDFGGGPLMYDGLGDIYVVKFDSDCHHFWSHSFGNSSYQNGYGIGTDYSDNIIITGDFSGSVDFGGGPLTSAGAPDVYLVKYDPDGNHLWSRNFGNGLEQSGLRVAIDPSNNIFLAGIFAGEINLGGDTLFCAGDSDIYLARFNRNGDHLWSHSYGDADNQYSVVLSLDNTGSVFISGTYQGSIDLGGGPLNSAGSTDIFLARLIARTDVPAVGYIGISILLFLLSIVLVKKKA